MDGVKAVFKGGESEGEAWFLWSLFTWCANFNFSLVPRRLLIHYLFTPASVDMI